MYSKEGIPECCIVLLRTKSFYNCYASSLNLDARLLIFLFPRLLPGLSLTLNIEAFEFTPGVSEGKGLRIVLHPYKTLPFVHKSGMSLSPGSEYYLGMSMVRI